MPDFSTPRTLYATALTLLLGIFPFIAQGTCQRPEAKPPIPNPRPAFDGSGAFGPLHETLTLDCLRYTGMIKNRNRTVAIVSDDRGKAYSLQHGDYLGEDSGVLEEIRPDYLLIRQTVYKNGNWVSRFQRLRRRE